MEEVVALVTNVGFPIAIAAYLLIRIEVKIDKLSSAISVLSAVIAITDKSDTKKVS